MPAPLFPTLNADAAVKAVLGANPLRVFPNGHAPPGVQVPYAVYLQYNGVPVDRLSEKPDMDRFPTQIDIYASSMAEARAVARVVRDCLQKVATITAQREMPRDVETKRSRYGMDVEFWTPR